MKNPPFAYVRPDTLDEALELLAEYGDEAKVLSGGQSLLPVMALRLGRPEIVIDIGRLPDLDTIAAGPDGVSIQALVRHAEAEFSPDVKKYAPLVHAAMPHVGHRAIRNRGTVVGSIAHADPAAEMPAVCLAAGATMTATSAAGQREIGALDFFEGYLETVLAISGNQTFIISIQKVIKIALHIRIVLHDENVAAVISIVTVNHRSGCTWLYQ